MSEKLKIYCLNNNQHYFVEGGTTLNELIDRKIIELPFIPLCAEVNNKIEGLAFTLYAPKNVRFLSIDSSAGKRVYIRSLCMLLFKAIKQLFPALSLRIEHSISKGYYCRLFKNDEVYPIDSSLLLSIKTIMEHDIKDNLPFIPHEILRSEAIHIFENLNLRSKVELQETRHDLYVNVYSLGDIYDSYYGPLVPSTKFLHTFDLQPYKEGFLMLGPDSENYFVSQKSLPQEKMFEAFTEHLKFNRIVGVRNIGELNKAVQRGHSAQLINVVEALHAKKIASIADEITRRYNEGGARVVLVAGPSSSGKTTTAQRLAIYLLTNLLRPVTISLDNYFVNRDSTPLDESGEKDFEHIEALDLNLFNEHLNKLLQGAEVEIPYYNFEKGKREYRGDRISLGNNGILLIEGIHGLNPHLTDKIDEKMKFRVYVSALTTLSIDDHNWIPTTDNRLLRRIIRDYKYRGTSARDTIRRWPSVRKGEEKWIFPFQENADAMFNSSLLFELAVMKEYGETILKSVPNDCQEYAEAYRLRKFLAYFEPITDKLIPPTSLLREFLGGSSLTY